VVAGYVLLFTESVSKSPSVYAQLRSRPPVLAVAYTLVPQGIIKTAALLATTDKNNGFNGSKMLKTSHVYAPKPTKGKFMLIIRGQYVVVPLKTEASQHLLLIIPIRCYRYH
jgi:hypothetical protein